MTENSIGLSILCCWDKQASESRMEYMLQYVLMVLKWRWSRTSSFYVQISPTMCPGPTTLMLKPRHLFVICTFSLIVTQCSVLLTFFLLNFLMNLCNVWFACIAGKTFFFTVPWCILQWSIPIATEYLGQPPKTLPKSLGSALLAIYNNGNYWESQSFAAQRFTGVNNAMEIFNGKTTQQSNEDYSIPHRKRELVENIIFLHFNLSHHCTNYFHFFKFRHTMKLSNHFKNRSFVFSWEKCMFSRPW